MTSPLNYRGDRQFPQSILDDLDARLRALESATSRQATADTPGKLARDAVRMLEGYAESYDAMARDPKGSGSVDCLSVAQDIRANMAGWFGAHLAEQATATQPAQTFEQWASDPQRADKIPLAKHPNGAYSDSRSYLIFYGWKSALKYGVARQAQTEPTLTGEQIGALRVAANALVEKYAAPIREILQNAVQPASEIEGGAAC